MKLDIPTAVKCQYCGEAFGSTKEHETMCPSCKAKLNKKDKKNK